jgi:hypothetical protein
LLLTVSQQYQIKTIKCFTKTNKFEYLILIPSKTSISLSTTPVSQIQSSPQSATTMSIIPFAQLIADEDENDLVSQAESEEDIEINLGDNEIELHASLSGKQEDELDTGDDQNRRQFEFMNLPLETRLQLYNLIPLHLLFELGNVSRQLHDESRKFLFSQEHIWYLYDHVDWAKILPQLADDTDYLGDSFPRCIHAAR